jgi:hypothetical protein
MLYEVKLIKNSLVLHKDGYPVTLHHKLKFENCNEIRAHAYLAFNNNVEILYILRAADEYMMRQGDYFKDIHCQHNSNSDNHDPSWILYESLNAIEEDGSDGIGVPRQVHATDVAFWARMLLSLSHDDQAEVNSHMTMGFFIEDMEMMLHNALSGDIRQKKRKPYRTNFKARLKTALDGSGAFYEGVKYA